MKERYVISSTQKIGNRVRLEIKLQQLVEAKSSLGVTDIISNISGTMNQMKEDAIFSHKPDVITISYEEWKDHLYKIDDVVLVNLEAEIK